MKASYDCDTAVLTLTMTADEATILATALNNYSAPTVGTSRSRHVLWMLEDALRLRPRGEITEEFDLTPEMPGEPITLGRTPHPVSLLDGRGDRGEETDDSR